VVEDYQKISDSSTASYIANSKAAMLYSGPWMFSKITELNPKIDLGWFYVPDDEGKYIAFNDVNSGWAITSDCAKDQKKYDAAVQFLKFFYSEDIYSQVCSIMNAMPVTNIDIKYESEVQDKVLQDFRKKAILTSDQIGSYDTPENFQNYLFMYVNDYIEGKYTLDEITGILDDTWDNCNNKPKD